MRYLIRYKSRVDFAHGAVREHHCELRIAPRDDVHQRVGRVSVKIEPETQPHAWRDSFGNPVHHFSLLPPHDYYATSLEAEVSTLLHDPLDYEPIPPAKERQWLDHALHAQPRLLSFVVHRSPATPELAILSKEHGLKPPGLAKGQSMLEGVQAAIAWINDHFTYTADGDRAAGSIHSLLKERAGTCHDLSHLLVTVLRAWGLPARYVSGYRPAAPPREPHAQPYAQSYAWTDVLIPQAGWRGFDVAARRLVNAEYVAAAVGRDHSDAEPRRGVFKGMSGEDDASIVQVQMIAQQ